MDRQPQGIIHGMARKYWTVSDFGDVNSEALEKLDDRVNAGLEMYPQAQICGGVSLIYVQGKYVATQALLIDDGK